MQFPFQNGMVPVLIAPLQKITRSPHMPDHSHSTVAGGLDVITYTTIRKNLLVADAGRVEHNPVHGILPAAKSHSGKSTPIFQN